MTDCHKKLEPGQYWLGKTAIGDDLVLDLRKRDFSLWIFSLPGGGKCNSIMAVASSFLETWIQAGFGDDGDSWQKTTSQPKTF